MLPIFLIGYLISYQMKLFFQRRVNKSIEKNEIDASKIKKLEGKETYLSVANQATREAYDFMDFDSATKHRLAELQGLSLAKSS